MTNGAEYEARGRKAARLSLYNLSFRPKNALAFAAEKSHRLRFSYTFRLICRGERLGAGGRDRHVIPSKSEGSHCPTVSALGQRYLGNARSRSYRTQPYRRAARHDMVVGLGAPPLLGRVCHFERSREISPVISLSFRLKHTKCAKRRNLPDYVSDTLCTAPRSVRSSASTLRKI